MGVQLINIGFGNMAAATRVIAIISPESAPVKRMIQDCRDKGELIDKAAVIIPPGFCRKSRIKDLAPSLRNFLTVALNCLTVGSLKVEIVMTPTCLFAGASFPITVSTVIFFRFMEKVACLLPRLTVTATVVPILPRILATAWVTVFLDTEIIRVQR